MRLRELTEGVGRITKQNQTVDVGPDEIKTQAKKFGNSVDRDGRPPTLSKKVKGKSTNVLFNLGLAESYKLQLERDKEVLVLHIKDTKTGKRTEVRGKPGYESGNYDPNDSLHILLDKVGKSANISELMNGEVVTINPKHPDADQAKAATDKAYSENFAEDKMGAINIDTALENTPKEWSEWIRTLPTELAQEFIDERPNPDQEDIDVFTKLRLTSKTPVEVSAKALLNEPWMKGSISRTPQPVVDAINKRYGTKFKSGTVYDRNPDRFFKYAEMPAATAKPSVMVNGDVIFGVGRMIAALLRGDSKIKVWELKG